MKGYFSFLLLSLFAANFFDVIPLSEADSTSQYTKDATEAYETSGFEIKEQETTQYETTSHITGYETTPGSKANIYLQPIDLVIIIAYLLGFLIFGLFILCRSDRSDVSGFFLAGRNITWFPIGASLFSSNITSGSFIGLAGAGAAAGIAVGAYEWNAILALILLGWVFAPAYLSSGVVTLPQYIQKRFGGQRIQIYLSILSLMIYIFVKISSDLFSGALFFKYALGWNIYAAMLVLLLITAIYTVTGGLKAVIYTDTVQTFIMFIGTTVMMCFAFREVGSYNDLSHAYMNATPSLRPPNSTCGLPRPDALHMFRDASVEDMPWPGMIFGLTIIDIWYWGTDQVIAQRTLAAKSLNHAKGGCIFAGLMKILPMYMMVMVGMISRVKFPDEVACVLPEECERYCGSPAGCSNTAYPRLVMEILPAGVKGLLLASMLAALMSSLSSVFNSASTLFTCDLWRKIRKNSSEWELMIVGRVFTLFMVVVAFFWVPVVQSSASGQLFDYIQSITSYLAPPITVIFLMAVSWPRLNEQGAFWGLMVGFVSGVIRMILDFSYRAPLCGQPESRPEILYKVHYLHFAILLAGLTAIVAVVVSLVTPASLHRPVMEETKVEAEPTDDNRLEEVRILEGNPEDDETDHEKKPRKKRRNSVLYWLRRSVVLFCGLDAKKKGIKPSIAPMPIVDQNEKKWHRYLVNCFAFINITVMIVLFLYYK